jgi:hypothetical protein
MRLHVKLALLAAALLLGTVAVHFHAPIGRRKAKPRQAPVRYAVFPAGIYSREDLIAAQNDPAVGAYYRSIGGEITCEPIQQAEAVFVDYRVGDHVWRTPYLVRLKAGEALCHGADATYRWRPRCGNLVWRKPKTIAPIAPIAAPIVPTASELGAPWPTTNFTLSEIKAPEDNLPDLPIATPEPLLPLAYVPSQPKTVWPPNAAVPIMPSVIGGVPFVYVQVAQTPEPGTLGIVALRLSVLFAKRKRVFQP